MNKRLFYDKMKILVFSKRNQELKKVLHLSGKSNIITNLNNTLNLIKVFKSINLVDTNNKHYKLIKNNYSFINLNKNIINFSHFLRPYFMFRVECFSLLNKDIFINQNENEFNQYIRDSIEILDFNMFDNESFVKFFLFYVNFIENLDANDNTQIYNLLALLSTNINSNLDKINESLLIKYSKSLLILFKINQTLLIKNVENFLHYLNKNKELKNPYLITLGLKLVKVLIEGSNELGQMHLSYLTAKIMNDYSQFRLEYINDYINFFKLIKTWTEISDNVYTLIFNQMISYFLNSCKNSIQLRWENKLYIVYLMYINRDETIRLSFNNQLKEIAEEVSKELTYNQKNIPEKKLNELTKQLYTILYN